MTPTRANREPRFVSVQSEMTEKESLHRDGEQQSGQIKRYRGKKQQINKVILEIFTDISVTAPLIQTLPPVTHHDFVFALVFFLSDDPHSSYYASDVYCTVFWAGGVTRGEACGSSQ